MSVILTDNITNPNTAHEWATKTHRLLQNSIVS